MSTNTQKDLTLLQKYLAIQKTGFEVEVPYEVYCVFGKRDAIAVLGNEVTLGEDYVSLHKARLAVEWYVAQLGGSVTWSKP